MASEWLEEFRKKNGYRHSSSQNEDNGKGYPDSSKQDSSTESSWLEQFRKENGYIGRESKSTTYDRVDEFNRGVDAFNQTMGLWGQWYDAAAGGLDSVGWADAGREAANKNESVNIWMNRIGQQRNWANEHKDLLGDDYEAVMKSLQDAATATYWMNKGYENTAEYFGQWDSQEAYDQTFAPTAQEEVMGKDVGQMQSDLDAMQQAYDDLDEILVYREAGYGTVPEAEREEKKAWHDQRYQEILDAYGINGNVSKWDLMARISELEDEIGETSDTQDSIRETNAEASRLAGYYMKYDGMTYSQLKQAMETVTDPQEKAWLEQYAPRKMEYQDYGIAIGEINTELYQLEKLARNLQDDPLNLEAGRLQELGFASAAEVNDRIEELKSQKWQLEHDREYVGLRSNADFDEKSGFVTSFVDADGNVVDTTKDSRYRYINSKSNPDAFLQPGTDNYSMDSQWIGSGGHVYGYMNEDEVKTYNYIVRTQGWAAANDYLEEIHPVLDERMTAGIVSDISDITREAPVFANALSVGMNLTAGQGILDIAAQNVGRKLSGSYKPVNYYGNSMTAAHASKAIRGTTAAMITDATGTIQLDEEKHPILAPILNGRGLADVYQLGMSAIDSRVAGMFGSPVLASILQSSSAATQGVLDALERGATDEQALNFGLWSGAFEAVFEYFEVDNLLKGKPSWVKAAVNQAITEGVGEGATSLANNIADAIIMADKSVIAQAEQEYIAQGMDPKKAREKALVDAGIGILWDAIGGAASGAMSVGGMAAGNAVMNQVQYATLPKTVKNSAERLQGFGMDKGAATDISIALYQGAEAYGDRAAAYMAAFDPKQDPYTYASDFRQAYEIGKNNGNREYLGKLSLNEDQRKIAYELGAAASRKAAQEATAPENSESDEERTYSVSDEGTTIDSTGKTVKVKGFASVGDKAVLELEDGKTIDAKEVSFGTEDEAVLYETVAQVSGSAETANRIMNSYSSVAGEISASDFAAGLRQAYDLGVSGQVAERQLGTYELAGKLPAAVRSAAFNRGKTVGDYKATARQAALEARGRQVKGQRQGQLHFDRKGRTFDSKRESSLKAMEALSKVLGVNIYVYESYVENGKRVYQDRTWAVESAPNGFYDKDGIHIDLNAGNFGQGTMMFTVAHELTHFIKEWSPVKFRKLADILVNRYAEQGTSVRELIDRQIAKAKENGREIDRDTAFEEVVADSMETMLTQGDIGQMMAELKQKDKTLAEKVREWFKNLANSLKAVADEYRGAKPESPEGRLVAQMDDFVQVLQQAYAEALVEAGENYRANDGNKKTTREGGRVLEQARSNKKHQAPSNSPLSRRSVMQRSSNSAHVNMSSAAAAGILGITNIADLNDDVKDAIAILGSFYQSVETQAPVLQFKRVINGSNLEGSLVSVGILNRQGDSGSAYRKDGAHELRISDHSAHADNFKGAGEHLSIALYNKTKVNNFLTGSPNVIEAVFKKDYLDRNPAVLKSLIRDIARFIATGEYHDTAGAMKYNYSGSTEFVASAQERMAEDARIRDSIKMSDRDYLEAVEAGNMEMTQRMVDEAAKSSGAWTLPNGKVRKYYHGTSQKFTEFDVDKFRLGNHGFGIYLTMVKDFASDYGEPMSAYLFTDRIASNQDHRITTDQVQSVADHFGIDLDSIKAGLADSNDASILQELQKAIVRETSAKPFEILSFLQSTFGYDGLRVTRETVLWDKYFVKSADPVTYDDAGNVIPLSERFDTTKSDIRYSERDAGAEKVAAELKRQNAKLKEDVKDLRELVRLQGKLTHGTEFTKSSIEKSMRSLIKAAGSNLNADDRQKMAGMLKDLYRYIAGDKELTWDGVEERAGAIADLLMNNVNIKAQRDAYADDILRYLRGTKIKLSDSQRAEVEKLYGYDNYRKMLFGAKVYIGQNGIDLDSLWHEASRPDMFGGTFKDDVNEGDQPAALLEIIENMREGDDSAAMEYAYNWEPIRQGLIQSIYDQYWQLENLETVADKKKAQVDKLREGHRKLMDEIREDQKYTLEKLRAIRENVLYTVKTDYEKGSYAPVEMIAEIWKTDRKRALGEFRQIENAFIQIAKDFERFGQQQVNQRAKDQKGFEKAREQFKKALKKEAEKHDKDNALWTREFNRLLKEYDKSGRKIERLEERYKTREENLAAGKQRAAVEKAAKSLMDMLSKPSKEAHVPMALQAPLEKFLNSIDFSSKRALSGGELTIRDVAYTRALQEVKTAIAKQRTALEGDADGTFSLDVPKDLLDRIEEHIGLINKATEGLDLTTNRVYEMTLDELKDLAFILKTINRAIRDIDKLHMAGAKARVSELGQSTVSEMDSREAVKTEDGGRFMWRNYTPTFAFERMGQAATQILNGLKMGQAKLARTAAAVIKFSNETYTNKEVKAWENEVHEVELDSGETVKMTTAQIMSFYCLSRRDQAKGHLTGGGIRMGNIGEGRKTVRQTKHFRLTQNDIAKINGLLTDRQIAVANKMQRYMADVGGRLGNEISMARWDYMEMTDRDYFPIRSDSDIHDAKNPDQDKTNLWALLNKSFTKAVVKDANDAMIVSSIFDVFADHMSDMAEYNAFALPLVDAMKWYNYRETTKYESGHVKTIGVKKALTDKLGTAAGEYFVDLMTDINSSQKAGRYENFFGKLLSRSKAASVGWNLRVAIQQPTAILRASVYLDPMSLVKGTVKKGMKASIEEMKKHSGIALWKSLGYYDLNISRGIRDQIKGDTTVLDQINDAGMWLPGKVDEATWSRIWESCKAQVVKEQKLSGERLLEETAKLFEDVVYHTQVADSVLTRSGLMRSKSQTLKELTSFMAEPTLSVNLLLNAFQDYREGVSKSDKVKRTMKILFCGYVLSAMANAIFTAFADAFRDDDEYEGYWDKFFQALLGEKFYEGNLFAELNPLEKIVFVRDVLSLLQGYEGAKNPFVELAESGIKLVQNIAKFFQGKGSLTAYGLIYQSLQVLGGFTGAAPANLLREASTIWNWTFGKWSNMPLHRYKTDPKSQIRDAYKSGALKKSEAREALMAAGISVTDAYYIIKGWDAGESVGRYDDVYKAALAGDDIGAAVAELVEHGEKTEKEVLSQLKSQIGTWYTDPESDTKIDRQEAEMMLRQYFDLDDKEIEEQLLLWDMKVETGFSLDSLKQKFLDEAVSAEDAVRYLMEYGGKDQEDAQARVDDWAFELQHGYSYDDIRQTYLDEEITADEAKSVMMEVAGKTEEQADYSLKLWDHEKEAKWRYEDRASLYKDGKITKEQLVDALIDVGEYDRKDAEYQVEVYEWEKAGLDGATIKRVQKWHEYCEKAGVTKEQFLRIQKFSSDTKNDVDANGKTINYSAMKKVMAEINKLPLSASQKDALAKSLGWSDKNIRKHKPW